MFDMNKPYRMRNGDKATILKKRRDGSFIVMRDADELLLFCDDRGKYTGNFANTDSGYDLINIPEEIEFWINVYKGTLTMFAYPTEKSAIEHQGANCIATKHIKVTVGEGL